MDLSKLNREILNKFCLKFECNLSEFKKSNNGKYYLKMFTGCHGPQPEFYVTETSCLGINYYTNIDLSEEWFEFLSSLNEAQINL